MLKRERLAREKKVSSKPKVAKVEVKAEVKTVLMPVTHLSSSSMQLLLRNPLMWKMKYVYKVWTDSSSVAAVVGKACHEALKFYYGGNSDIPVPIDDAEAIGMAKQLGLEYIDKYPDGGIKWGKTGTREGMLKTYQQVIDFYFAEAPDYHEVLLSEQKLEAEIKTKTGDILPLVAVTIPDLVVRNEDGTIDIVDTKFVGSFTDSEKEDYPKIIQAKFLEHVVHADKGWDIARVIFRETKTSENKDGSPQMRDYIVPCDHVPYDIFFYNLYKDCVRFISNPDVTYLPNIADQYEGEEAGLIYAQGLISADMSDVEVMHKVKDVMLTSKKFVQSRTDSVENKNLLPEEKIKLKLGEFGIPVEPVGITKGATVTLYSYKVSAGIPMSRFAKYKADIAKVLESKSDIRILAPIPGTAYVGIEVVNEERGIAKLDESELTMNSLVLAIGQDVTGKVVKANLVDMPHLLIAGSSNSGKSVLLGSLLTSITKQMKPADIQLILIDPKRVELVAFSKVPHLHDRKIIYEYDDAVRALLNVVDVMEERYQKLEQAQCRNIEEYNKTGKHMQYIVLVIDEFADLIMRANVEEKSKDKAYSSRSFEWLVKEAKSRDITLVDTDESSKTELKKVIIEKLEQDDSTNEMKRADANVELLIVRIAQLGRAAGIHLIVATQNPIVEVVTSMIKANMQTRIALTCASAVNSQVILGEPGAEKLTGKGDMIFSSPSTGKVRLQGYF